MERKALIVEDDISTRKLIKHILEGFDLQCMTADTGVKAIKSVVSSIPDIIILDISMPEMSGEDFFLWLKSDLNYTYIPVIFLTAISSPERITRLLDLGAEDYMIKPFDSNVLLARIRKAFRNKDILNHNLSKEKQCSCQPNQITALCNCNRAANTEIKKIEYMGLIWQARLAGDKIFVSSVPFCPVCNSEFSVSKEWAGFLKRKYWYCKKCKQKHSFNSKRLSKIYSIVRHKFEDSFLKK